MQKHCFNIAPLFAHLCAIFSCYSLCYIFICYVCFKTTIQCYYYFTQLYVFFKVKGKTVKKGETIDLQIILYILTNIFTISGTFHFFLWNQVIISLLQYVSISSFSFVLLMSYIALNVICPTLQFYYFTQLFFR